MTIATAFILCHEFVHQYLGHLSEDSPRNPEDWKEDEFTTDRLAADAVLNGINYTVPGYEHTVKLGITVGISSLLFTDSSLNGGEVHPDTDQRIHRVITQIAENQGSEYWVHAIVLLNLWELVFHRKLTPISSSKPPKEEFEWLSLYLKSL